ncbi:hypothetical protein CMO83_03865 [Candidatus Woesearchaeota archaeon]|jgi:hypothetical protein|nr:hypothetical protein [Candidatus Woesearchaeota archaeon]MAG91786.1 hypothetical protein [Candidatus Woesearchaeota archaeon]|tara:strand:+ start:25145 stop:26341 length:1197 start_codon:yes stop_codon:yes gene_type:complete
MKSSNTLFVILIFAAIFMIGCTIDPVYYTDENLDFYAEEQYNEEVVDKVEEVDKVGDVEQEFDDEFYDEEEFYDDEYFFMEPEDCFEGEKYDPVEKLCYIDCDTEEECLRIEEEISQNAEDIGEDFFEGEEDFKDIVPEDITILAKYNINGEAIQLYEKPALDDNSLKTLQDDSDKHQIIWDRYKSLIPLSNTPFLVEYHVGTDGKEETFAAVNQNEKNLKNWDLMIDIQDAFVSGNELDKKELTYTLIHEFGHLLTLNEKQVDLILNADLSDDDFIRLEKNCNPNFFTREGCTKKSSYMNLFFSKFWKGTYDEFLGFQEIEDDDEYYEALDNFYIKYESRFVTDYAATNPGEDIAESWTAFVLQEKPNGNKISDQKAKFFYDFPELVKLRKIIRARI